MAAPWNRERLPQLLELLQGGPQRVGVGRCRESALFQSAEPVFVRCDVLVGERNSSGQGIEFLLELLSSTVGSLEVSAAPFQFLRQRARGGSFLLQAFCLD